MLSGPRVDFAHGTDNILVPPTPTWCKVAEKSALPIYADQVSQDIKNRLGRIEGQVRGVAKMADEQRPCIELLEQLASIQAALKGATRVVLRNYLERCVAEGIRRGDAAIYDQVLEIITKFAK